MLLSKAEISPNSSFGFKHRFLILMRIKNKELRKRLFQIFFFNEILFFCLLWLSLSLISIFFLFKISTFSYLEITGIIIGLIAFSYFIFRKIAKRINIFNQLIIINLNFRYKKTATYAVNSSSWCAQRDSNSRPLSS